MPAPNDTKAIIKKLTGERDSARREYCILYARYVEWGTFAEGVAHELGWDCYKKPRKKNK